MMATDYEIKKNQKAVLSDLLKIKLGIKTLDDVIYDYKAEMTQEDFAYVVEVVNEEKKLIAESKIV